jgi:thiamine kinase-like enzyme
MKRELKSIIEGLNPKSFGIEKISIGSFTKLGVGEGNLNYLFQIKGRRLICRVNVDKRTPNKSQNEFNSLRDVEGLGIAPKAYYYHRNSKKFPYEFIILEYIEGKPFRMKKRSYTSKQIGQIAHILAKLHSKKCNSFHKEKYSYQHFLKESLGYNKAINKYNDKLRNELKRIHTNVKRFLPKTEAHRFGLIHGDVCPQNIIQTRNGLRLIDWESLQCSDPAKDVANVLIDLGLRNDDLILFLKEYHEIRRDAAILKRAGIYAALFRYTYFLWEIIRSFEIIHKELPREYLNKTTAQRHINEARFQYRKLSQLIKMPNIDFGVLFEGQLETLLR